MMILTTEREKSRSRTPPALLFWLGVLAVFLSPLAFAQNTSTGEEDQARVEDTEDSLEPVGPADEVTVTAARTAQPVRDAAASVTVIDGVAVRQSSSLVLDDFLRQVPGFSLFRRNSSLTAHPTTQGVSLRGIGPSGTSRSLVLFDGIPLNDPFGGWVYWNRVPLQAIEQVEIVRGASSQLYGSSALGGAIQILSRRPAELSFGGQMSGGQHGLFDSEFLLQDRKSDWGYLAAGRIFDLDGFFVVDEATRGSVDRPVALDFQSFFGRVFVGDWRAGVSYYNEDRGNGTRLQTNHSDMVLFDVGLRKPSFSLNFYTQSGVLESQFSRLTGDRSQEFPTAFQRFESNALGASATKLLGSDLMIGSDWRYVSWEQNHQNLWGLFVQKLTSLSRAVDLQAGLRFDLWENREVQTSLNPRLGLLYRSSPFVTLRSSLYRGFRAPTLNELYRPFRVGNIVTAENPELGAENLWGVEGGADFYPSSNSLLRLNVFWNRLEDPVSNVTLSVSDDLIRRQRRNLGEARVWGLEAEGEWRFHDRWGLDVAYLMADSEVSSTGLRIPQVPRHQFTAGIRRKGRTGMTWQMRALSSQFEDDRNELPLDGFVVFDFSVRHALSESLEAHVSIENLFDRRFSTGRTPVERLGEPRIAFGGIRLRFGD